MLDRLSRKHNKLFLLIFLLLFSCGGEDLEKPGVYHTELICEDHDIILIRYSRLEQVRHAIARSYASKKHLEGSEGYTVISLPGNRSMKIDKLIPEDAIKCNLRELFHPRYDKYKKKYMETPHYNPLW